MTNEEEISFAYITRILKEYAETKTCYDRTPDYQPYDCADYNYAFEDGADYGEIHLARTLLEQIGVEFEYPMMKEND